MDRAISSASQSFIPPTDPAAPLAIGDELMTVNDAARFFRVTVSWVYEHTHVVDASHRAAIESLEQRLFPTVPKSQKADTAGESEKSDECGAQEAPAAASERRREVAKPQAVNSGEATASAQRDGESKGAPSSEV